MMFGALVRKCELSGPVCSIPQSGTSGIEDCEFGFCNPHSTIRNSEDPLHTARGADLFSADCLLTHSLEVQVRLSS
jgi:hypothetical protein